jgi:hypothetical protein
MAVAADNYVRTIVALDAILDICDNDTRIDADGAAQAVEIDGLVEGVDAMRMSLAADHCIATIGAHRGAIDLDTVLDAAFCALGDTDALPTWRPELRAAIIDDAPVGIADLAADNGRGLAELIAITSFVTRGDFTLTGPAAAAAHAAAGAANYLGELTAGVDDATVAAAERLATRIR